MVVVPDKQGDASESQDEFKGDNKDVLHNGFYKLGEMAQTQLSRLWLGVLT